MKSLLLYTLCFFSTLLCLSSCDKQPPALSQINLDECFCIQYKVVADNEQLCTKAISECVSALQKRLQDAEIRPYHIQCENDTILLYLPQDAIPCPEDEEKRQSILSTLAQKGELQLLKVIPNPYQYYASPCFSERVDQYSAAMQRCETGTIPQQELQQLRTLPPELNIPNSEHYQILPQLNDPQYNEEKYSFIITETPSFAKQQGFLIDNSDIEEIELVTHVERMANIVNHQGEIVASYYVGDYRHSPPPDMKDYTIRYTQNESSRIHVTLTPLGANKMQTLTSGMKLGQEQLAVVFNGRILCAPIVQTVLHGELQITGEKYSQVERIIMACIKHEMPHTVIFTGYTKPKAAQKNEKNVKD